MADAPLPPHVAAAIAKALGLPPAEETPRGSLPASSTPPPPMPRGAIPGSSLRATDGDTVIGRTGPEIRISGYDSPEVRHSGKVDYNPIGDVATEATQGILMRGGYVTPPQAGGGSYGRDLAELRTESGTNPGIELIENGLAGGLPYSGGAAQAQAETTASARRMLGIASPVSPELRPFAERAENLRNYGKWTPITDHPFADDFGKYDDREGSNFGKAIDRGMDETTASVGGALNYLGDRFGVPSWVEKGKAMAADSQYNVAMNPRAVEDFGVALERGPSAVATYLVETFGELGPGLIVDAALATTGAGVGAVVGRRTGAMAIKAGLEKGLVSSEAAAAATEALRTGVKNGILAGAAVSSGVQSTGNMENSLEASGSEINPIAPLVSGAANAALETVALAPVINRVSKAAGLGKKAAPAEVDVPLTPGEFRERTGINLSDADAAAEIAAQKLTKKVPAPVADPASKVLGKVAVAKDIAATAGVAAGAEAATSVAQMLSDEAIRSTASETSFNLDTRESIDSTIRALVGGGGLGAAGSAVGHGARVAMDSYTRQAPGTDITGHAVDEEGWQVDPDLGPDSEAKAASKAAAGPQGLVPFDVKPDAPETRNIGDKVDSSDIDLEPTTFIGLGSKPSPTIRDVPNLKGGKAEFDRLSRLLTVQADGPHKGKLLPARDVFKLVDSGQTTWNHVAQYLAMDPRTGDNQTAYSHYDKELAESSLLDQADEAFVKGQNASADERERLRPLVQLANEIRGLQGDSNTKKVEERLAKVDELKRLLKEEDPEYVEAAERNAIVFDGRKMYRDALRARGLVKPKRVAKEAPPAVEKPPEPLKDPERLIVEDIDERAAEIAARRGDAHRHRAAGVTTVKGDKPVPVRKARRRPTEMPPAEAPTAEKPVRPTLSRRRANKTAVDQFIAERDAVVESARAEIRRAATAARRGVRAVPVDPSTTPTAVDPEVDTLTRQVAEAKEAFFKEAASLGLPTPVDAPKSTYIAPLPVHLDDGGAKNIAKKDPGAGGIYTPDGPLPNKPLPPEQAAALSDLRKRYTDTVGPLEASLKAAQSRVNAWAPTPSETIAAARQRIADAEATLKSRLRSFSENTMDAERDAAARKAADDLAADTARIAAERDTAAAKEESDRVAWAEKYEPAEKSRAKLKLPAKRTSKGRSTDEALYPVRPKAPKVTNAPADATVRSRAATLRAIAEIPMADRIKYLSRHVASGSKLAKSVHNSILEGARSGLDQSQQEGLINRWVDYQMRRDAQRIYREREENAGEWYEDSAEDREEMARAEFDADPGVGDYMDDEDNPFAGPAVDFSEAMNLTIYEGEDLPDDSPDSRSTDQVLADTVKRREVNQDVVDQLRAVGISDEAADALLANLLRPTRAEISARRADETRRKEREALLTQAGVDPAAVDAVTSSKPVHVPGVKFTESALKSTGKEGKLILIGKDRLSRTEPPAPPSAKAPLRVAKHGDPADGSDPRDTLHMKPHQIKHLQRLVDDGDVREARRYLDALGLTSDIPAISANNVNSMRKNIERTVALGHTRESREDPASTIEVSTADDASAPTRYVSGDDMTRLGARENGESFDDPDESRSILGRISRGFYTGYSMLASHANKNGQLRYELPSLHELRADTVVYVPEGDGNQRITLGDIRNYEALRSSLAGRAKVDPSVAKGIIERLSNPDTPVTDHEKLVGQLLGSTNPSRDPMVQDVVRVLDSAHRADYGSGVDVVDAARYRELVSAALSSAFDGSVDLDVIKEDLLESQAGVTSAKAGSSIIVERRRSSDGSEMASSMTDEDLGPEDGSGGRAGSALIDEGLNRDPSSVDPLRPDTRVSRKASAAIKERKKTSWTQVEKAKPSPVPREPDPAPRPIVRGDGFSTPDGQPLTATPSFAGPAPDIEPPQPLKRGSPLDLALTPARQRAAVGAIAGQQRRRGAVKKAAIRFLEANHTRLRRIHPAVDGMMRAYLTNARINSERLVAEFDREFVRAELVQEGYEDMVRGVNSEAARRYTSFVSRIEDYIAEAQPDYVRSSGNPIHLDLAKVERERDGFLQILRDAGIVDPHLLLDSILTGRGYAALSIKPSHASLRGNDSLAPARKALRDGGYLDNDAPRHVRRMIHSAASWAEWSRANGQQVIGDDGTPLTHSKGPRAGTPIWDSSAKYKAMEKEVHPLNRDEFARLMEGMLGIADVNPHPFVRNFNALAMAVQAGTLYWFTAVASIPEIAAVYSASREGFSSVLRDTRDLFSRMKRDEARQAAEDYLIVSDGTISHSILSMYSLGETTTGRISEKVADIVFTINQQHRLTRFTRTLAVKHGQRFLERNARSNSPRAVRYLAELGIDADTVIEHLDSLEAGVKPDIESRAGAAYRDALHRFVNSAITNPSHGQVPLIATDPRFILFTSLKKFLYGFYDNVHKALWREGVNRRAAGDSTFESIKPMLLTAAMLVPLAALAEYIRELIKYPFGRPEALERDAVDWTASILGATAALGPLQTTMSAYEVGGFGGNPALQLAGPMPQLAVDIAFGDATLPRFLPVANQVPWLKQMVNDEVKAMFSSDN